MEHTPALGISTVYSQLFLQPIGFINSVLTVGSSLGPLVPKVTCAPLFLAIFVTQNSFHFCPASETQNRQLHIRSLIIAIKLVSIAQGTVDQHSQGLALWLTEGLGPGHM